MSSFRVLLSYKEILTIIFAVICNAYSVPVRPKTSKFYPICEREKVANKCSTYKVDELQYKVLLKQTVLRAAARLGLQCGREHAC
jgi:hypothetical protein